MSFKTETNHAMFDLTMSRREIVQSAFTLCNGRMYCDVSSMVVFKIELNMYGSLAPIYVFGTSDVYVYHIRVSLCNGYL